MNGMISELKSESTFLCIGQILQHFLYHSMLQVSLYSPQTTCNPHYSKCQPPNATYHSKLLYTTVCIFKGKKKANTQFLIKYNEVKKLQM